jgi:small GTP-binding protein
MSFDHTLKIIIVGDSSVGKSNIMNVFVNRNFQEVNESTVGVEFASKIVNISNIKYRTRIWDTAGQEAFRSITSAYYRGTDGCLIVYSISDRQSFESIHSWILDIRSKSVYNIPIILVANKADTDNRQVSTYEGEQLAKDYGFPFFETSAKTAYNINNVFISLIERINTKGEEEPHINIHKKTHTKSFWSYC